MREGLLRKGKIPRWCSRVCQCMSPGLAQALQDGRKEALCWLRGAVGGSMPGTTLHYVLWNRSTYYIGKTNMWRQHVTGFHARCIEHMRAFLVCGSREGQKPRYKLLRRAGARHVRMMPVSSWASKSRALAAEAMLINMLGPPCNQMDDKTKFWDARAVGRSRPKGRRRRPPKWRRIGRRPFESVWEHDGMIDKVIQRDAGNVAPGGAQFLALPFNALYCAIQKENLTLYGSEGPLWIMQSLPLFLR
eukprot:927749-Amphidinium_carterae.2